MNRKTVGFIICLEALMGMANAADAIDYSQYVQFTMVNTTQQDYCFSRQNGWSSGDAPAPGFKYYVPVDKVLASEYSSNDPHTFKGDELAIAGGFLHVREANKKTVVPVMAFCQGGYFTCGKSQKAGTYSFESEHVEIRSDGREPAQFRYPADSEKTSYPQLTMKFYGAEDAEFEFVNTGTGSNTFGFHLNGALTNYLGTMTIAEGARPKLTLADNAVPSTLKVRDGGVLDMSLVSADLTVGTLSWADGGILSFPVTNERYAKIIVTNALQVSGTPRFALVGLSNVGAGEPPSYPLFILSGPAAENVPDLSGVAGTPIAGPLPHWRLFVTANDDGTKTVFATYKEIVTLVNNYSSTTAKYSALYDGNGSYWSNGELPTSGYDYHIISNMLWYSGGPSSFAGDSLTIASDKIVRCARTVTVNDLNLDGCTWMFIGANNAYLHGRVTAWPGVSTFSGYNGNRLVIDAAIAGNGELDFKMYTGIKSPGISYVLAGDNSAFAGKIKITTPVYAGASDKPAVPDLEKGYYTKVQINDDYSLGGAYAGSDNWCAVTLEKQSRIVVTNDIALSEPTRGLFVSGTGYVQVADGATLALDSQLALGGELVKLGGGVLSLGGCISFIDGNPATSPAEGTNRISVVEGALKVSSANVCNGTEISFEKGTRLIVDASSGGEIAECGLCNVVWGTPLRLGNGMDALPVEFELPSGFDRSSKLRLGICTFNPDAASGFDVGLFAVKRVPHMFAKVVRVENSAEDGSVESVTFACDFSPAGLRILVR